jgi:two-component system, chemotaxis family, protein-glutamate methylesterase/glutaminase
MIRVLVVDDSAVMRALLSRIVNAQPDMSVVAVASDPVVAIEQIRLKAPDVMTLDVEMPRMNGLEFLRKLMAVRPLPVIMISSRTRQGADVTMRALELGAVDFVEKPADLTQFEASANDIADKIRAANSARVARHGLATAAVPPETPARQTPPGPAARDRVIAIGASTGGVEALREVLAGLPARMPPILIAQHMPAGYTETFARRLNSICRIDVKQAEDGETALNGAAYIAPGGRHLTLVRRSSAYVLRVTDDPPVNRHRPSVDPLFRTVAKVALGRAIGVMLTGMGADGAQAMLDLSNAGAYTIAQDEASCVVFGMPRQAISVGAVREVMPLGQIGRRLIELSET